MYGSYSKLGEFWDITLGNPAQTVLEPKIDLFNIVGTPNPCYLGAKKWLFFGKKSGTYVKKRFSYYTAAVGRGYKSAGPMRVQLWFSANESATPQNAEHAFLFSSLFE